MQKYTSCLFFMMISLFVCFVMFYFSHSVLSVCSANVIQEKVISTRGYSVIVSVAKISKIFPMLISGILIDLTSGRFFFGLCEILGGAFIILMGIRFFRGEENTGQLIVFGVLYGLFSIAACFPYTALVKIESKWVKQSSLGKWNSFLSLSYLLGESFCKLIISFLLMINMTWESIFFLSGGITLFFGIYALIFLRDNPYSCKIPQKMIDGESESSSINNEEIIMNKPKKMSLRIYITRVLFPLLKDFRFYLLLFWYFYPKTIRYLFSDWMSIYFVSQYGISPSTAGIISSFLPLIGGLGGVYLGFLFDVSKKQNRSERKKYVLVGVFLVCISIFFLLFYKINDLGRGIDFSKNSYKMDFFLFAIVVVLMCVISFLSVGIYSVSSVFAIIVGGKEGCATIAGFFDCIAYVTSFFSSLFIGHFASIEKGWNYVFLLFSAVGIIPIVISTLLIIFSKN